MEFMEGRLGENEKITINLGYVDLGQVDLLVREGFYSNRTDFIRTAIRNQLDRQADMVRQSVARRGLDLGLREITRAELETLRESGKQIDIQVLGLAIIASDVSIELAHDTIASIRVLGHLQAPPGVKAAMKDRMRS
jgi:Arc/MetJ-type ribon-helix-helix transcriptional regulator